MPLVLRPGQSRRVASPPGMRSIVTVVLPRGQYNLGLRTGLIAFCAGSLLVGAVAHAEDGRSAASTSVQADQGVEALLRQVERQITVGHTTAPESDNAVGTWLRVLDVVSPASHRAVSALTDFVAYMRRRAADEQAAGRTAIAINLLVFADEATEVLQRESAAPTSSLAASSPVPVGDVSLPTLSTGLVSRDTRLAEAPNGQSTTLVEPRRNQIGSTQRPKPAGDTAATDAFPVSGPVGKEAMVSALGASRPAVASTVLAGHPVAPEQPAAAFFVSRGDAMLAIKDISAARKFYEHAANVGSARAAAALAKTYDPGFTNQLGALGLRSDPAVAADWYRKAAALGNRAAEVRLQTLKVEAAR
jgi:hypothetical protein